MGQHDAAEEVNNVIDLEECTAYKVVDMLKDEALCEALVTWMMREFSVENVLSFMEMVHFKRYVKKIKDNQATIAAQEVQVKYIEFYCDKVPISSIISKPRPGMGEMEKCREMAHELWLKYINVGSLFEINIGYGLRGKYENYDGNNWTMSVDELLCVFDEAMLEAHHMMRQSLGRWKVDMRKKGR